MFGFKIIRKPPFAIMGYSRKFDSKNSYNQIPKFWEEHYLNVGKTKGGGVLGIYGVCFDCGSNGEFSYMIADDYDSTKCVPCGAEVKYIPELVWAVFPCKGKLPQKLQEVNSYVFNEWLPDSKQYRMVGDLNIEAYSDAVLLKQNRANDIDEYYSEIWIPVEEI